MKLQFGNFEFDVLSAIATILLVPLFIGILSLIRKHSLKLITNVIDFGAYLVSRYIRKEVLVSYTLRQYCRYCLSIEAYKYMYIPSSQDIVLPTDSTYVPLILEQDLRRVPISDEELLDCYSRTRIYGDPGSGKSTLVKKLFRMLCRQALRSKSCITMPIVIELRKLTIALNTNPIDLLAPKGEWLYNQIIERVKQMEIYGINDCFDAMIKGNGITLFLDGLDEVSKEYEEVIIEEINGISNILSNKSPLNRIVITMRTQYHHITKTMLLSEFPNALHLKSFSLEDIYTFLEKWPFKNDQEQSTTRIYSQLGDHPSLRDLCRNPLILSMYVAEDQSTEFLVAPDSRTSFYNKILSELLIKRRMRQTGPSIAYSKIRDIRESILGRIAFAHLLDEEQASNLISWNRSIDIVSNDLLISKTEAEKLLVEIATETGIITFEQPFETIRFIHLSICEYFAAYEAVNSQDNGWITIIRKFEKWNLTDNSSSTSRLIEVIPFVCGLMSKKDRVKALSRITRLKNSILMIKCFLETKTYDNLLWLEFVEVESDRINDLLKHNVTEIFLYEFYLFMTALRDAEVNVVVQRKAMESVTASEIIVKLIEKYKDKVKSLLIAYAQQDGVSALRVASLAGLDTARDYPEVLSEACEQAPALAWIVTYIRSQPKGYIKYIEILLDLALRKKVVARWLINHEPIEEFIIDDVHNIQRKFMVLKDTLYGQLIYYMSLEINKQEFSRTLKCIAKLKTQRYYVTRILITTLYIPAVFLVMITGIWTIKYLFEPFPGVPWEISLIVLSYGLLLYLIEVYQKIQTMRYIYLEIFNLNVGSRILGNSDKNILPLRLGSLLVIESQVFLMYEAMRRILFNKQKSDVVKSWRSRQIHAFAMTLGHEMKEMIDSMRE